MLKNKKITLRNIAIIISLLSLITSYTVNSINLTALTKNNIELRCGETVITSDDISYISPALNLIDKGTLKNNTAGKGAYFSRTPGYSLIISSLYYFLSLKHTLFLLKIIQLLLFGLSVYCLFFIAYKYLNSRKGAIFITLFYGISNIASNFIFYTLTEGVTPQLLIFYTFFLLKAKGSKQHKILFYYLSAVIFAFIFITRPVLGIFGLAMPFFLISDYWQNKKILIKQMLIVGCIAVSGMFLWQIRNYKLTDNYVGLHPIYYSENSNSCFRPTHQKLWSLCKGWGEIGSNFHSYIQPFWQSAISGNPTDKDIENIISQLPQKVVKKLQKERFVQMFKTYQQSVLYQKYFYDNNLPMPNIIPQKEQETINQINNLIADYKKYFWFDYYILSPLKVFKELTFHSNLSLYIFQKPFRGNWLMEFLRFICFVVHSLAFVTILFSLFFKKPNYIKSAFVFPTIIYIGYLIFIQRGIEERYTLPILWLALLNFAYLFNSFKIQVARFMKF